MKKALFSLCLAAFFSCSSEKGNDKGNDNANEPLPCKEADGPVACYGKLQVNGNKLTGSKTGTNRAVQLRGVSLGWSNTGWESARFFTEATVNAMVDDWKAEIIRVPMGHSISIHSGEYGGSYMANKDANMTRVTTAIDAAIAKGVYVIIDWHSHYAHLRPEEAEEFFGEMTSKYGQNDNVIFEIYNEPKCKEEVRDCDPYEEKVPWADIKSYAEQIIPVIRANSSNLILVGTRFFSRYVNDVINNEPSCNGCENLAYVLHFYAQNHTLDRYVANANDQNDPSFRQAITQAMDAGLHVFISEYGTTNSNGGQGEHYESHSDSSANVWHAFMDEKKISSCAWHINDKAEGSAFFGLSPRRIFDMASWADEEQMTASGKYIFNKLRAYAAEAEWRGK
jgi:endoglucanase